MRHIRMLSSLLVVAIGLLTSVAPVQGSVPPEILAQLKSMSPPQQRALARQYGLNLDEILGLAESGDGFIERPALGAPGEPLEQTLLYEIEDKEAGKEFLAEEDSVELQRFGAKLFDSEVSTFAPVDNIPVPEGYRLGVGDELQVMLIGKEQGEFPLLVDRDGSVTLPKLGRVILSGLTFPEAKTLIEKRVSEQLIGSEAILSMGSLRSINVFIAGEVNKPGNYSVSALSTLSQAVYVAGGISDVGSFRTIQLKRQGKTVGSFDIYDLLLYGNNSSDVRLQSGDVVFVPLVSAQASVSGSVVRPAIYELKPDTTLQDLLSMAGGALATANTRQALLKRYQPDTPLSSISNLDLAVSENLDALMVDGDSLFVPSKSERISNPILIEGETELSEVIGWSEGLRVSNVFNDLEADVKATADRNLSLIVRRKNQLNEIEVLSFSLSSAVLNPSSQDNVELRPFDRIVVLPNSTADEDVAEDLDIEDQTITRARPELEMTPEANTSEESRDSEDLRRELISPIVEQLERQTRFGERAQVVVLAGAVRQPGVYPIIGDGSIANVVALAGGYTDAAYLERVEIRRIVLNQAQQAEIEISNINLAKENGSSFKVVGRDTVRINTIPNWTTEDTVELSGEFVFPGAYTISEGESISSLIERAGGFTSEAFLSGAQYFSAAARESQTQQLKKISASVSRQFASRKSAGELTEGMADAEIENIIDEELLGRVVIDLQSIVEGDETADSLVDDGDTLFVPKFTNTIAVVGEVYEPGTFRFEEGVTLDEYVRIAGGETSYALTRNIYLLKADGSVRFYRSGALKSLMRFDAGVVNGIEAGDVIVVPTNLDYDRPLTRVSAITNVVFQSLTSIAAFLSIANQ